MADNSNTQEQANGQSAGQSAGQGGQPGFGMVINAQYVKDLSFENPGAPQSLMMAGKQPDVGLKVDIAVRHLKSEEEKKQWTAEVVLTLHVDAKIEDKQTFLIELAYGGVFTLTGLDKAQANAVLSIEAPRMLFPYARAIISEATRDGGFAPLMVNPIDFAEIYRQRIMQAQKQAEQAAGNGGNGTEKKTA